MRTLPLLVLLASAAASAERREVGSLVLDGVPDVPPEIARRMAQYQNVRGALFADWQPEGGAYVLTRFAETSQVHAVGAPGAYREQLTFFDEPVAGLVADPRPGARRFVFLRDAGGGEFYQLYLFERATGRERLLTDGKSRNESPLWSRSGTRLAHTSTRRNGRDFDLYVLDPSSTDPARLVKELEGQWAPLDWSPDDQRLLLQRYVSIRESYLHVLDVATGELREVRPRPGERISYATAVFVTDGELAYASDEGSEFLRLYRHDLRTGKRRELAPGLSWDVVEVVASRDGRQLAWVVNEGGAGALWLASGAGRPQRVALPRGVLSNPRFDGAGRRLAFSLNGADAPDDLYVLDTKTRRVERWTFSETGGLPRESFVEPSLVQFPSFDGRRIPAWLYRPPEAKGRRPVIVSIHGGPEAQATASFAPNAQFWVNELDAAVLVPNVRGSAGYGKTYLQLDDGERREDSVSDIGALLDWVGTQPDLDPARVAVIGGSYGGYMVLATMVRYPERVRCGVDIVGIASFVSFLERTEAYRRDLRRAEYGDERDPKMRALLEAISPLAGAKAIRRPLFVVHGANDPRVPLFEAEQIVKTVRGHGGTVWYLVARDEGHGFRKKRNRDHYLNLTTMFFLEHLLK